MSLSHCIHQTLNIKASTRFHSGGLQQSSTLILNTFLFGVIILIANILKRAFSSQLAAKLRNRLLRSEERFSRNAETELVCCLHLAQEKVEHGVGGGLRRLEMNPSLRVSRGQSSIPVLGP